MFAVEELYRPGGRMRYIFSVVVSVLVANDFPAKCKVMD
jgi:hypothetical protein